MCERHGYDVIIPPETASFGASYFSQIQQGTLKPGARFAREISDYKAENSNFEYLLDALINTKQPCIFAESEVYGDGRDWTMNELKILGDISIAADVTVFDDGRHTDPLVFESPFAGTLVFVPGALLRNDTGSEPADWYETTKQGQINEAGYDALYKRRLLPVLQYVDQRSAAIGTAAVVTIPGLGCGQFAGPLQGSLGARLEQALCKILEAHAHDFPNIRVIHYDPYSECDCSSRQFEHLTFLTRPLTKYPDSRPQLRTPNEYVDSDSTDDYRLFSLVAWDHVSWPGNDFYIGARSTDDGVKGAATSVMSAITGVQGRYDRITCRYMPPSSFETWESVVKQHGVRLKANQSI